jgi:thiamine pyrophosphate-dependent acetolactate synthase large subunit-like protein
LVCEWTRIPELVRMAFRAMFAGRAVMSQEHPLCFLSQSLAADEPRRKADVMLVVGSRVGNLGVPFDQYWGDAAVGRVIQSDVDPRHIAVPRPTLKGITSRLRGRKIASQSRTDVQSLHQSYGA